MKKRRIKINTRQVVVNHIDAKIIVEQQKLIAEYERFNEQIMLMLNGDPNRRFSVFGPDTWRSFYHEQIERNVGMFTYNQKEIKWLLKN